MRKAQLSGEETSFVTAQLAVDKHTADQADEKYSLILGRTAMEMEP